ncbi:2-oxoacid:acceptor oxidoreductase family protein [Omnitrophica bacterium]|nr:2-oxoacid:acceptor oxidoreductase family protein [Candidatus Omnitrophota bacterium]
MIEIRFHGRGGQGAVIASNILAEAAFREGKSVQSFPHFGVERRGAPVAAFTRIAGKDIRVKHEIYNPDCIVILDPTLIEAVDVVKGLKGGGLILINTDKRTSSFGFKGNFRIATVDASHIAARHGLGSKASPIVNTAVMGAFSRFTRLVKLESVLKAIEERVPIKKRENCEAAEEAYEKVRFKKG